MPKAKKKKPKVTEIHPQTVLKGMVVISKDSKKEEVVRSVSVVLNLANGMTEPYHDGEVVKVVEQEPVEFPKELTGDKEA